MTPRIFHCLNPDGVRIESHTELRDDSHDDEELLNSCGARERNASNGSCEHSDKSFKTQVKNPQKGRPRGRSSLSSDSSKKSQQSEAPSGSRCDLLADSFTSISTESTALSQRQSDHADLDGASQKGPRQRQTQDLSSQEGRRGVLDSLHSNSLPHHQDSKSNHKGVNPNQSLSSSNHTQNSRKRPSLATEIATLLDSGRQGIATGESVQQRAETTTKRGSLLASSLAQDHNVINRNGNPPPTTRRLNALDVSHVGSSARRLSLKHSTSIQSLDVSKHVDTKDPSSKHQELHAENEKTTSMDKVKPEGDGLIKMTITAFAVSFSKINFMKSRSSHEKQDEDDDILTSESERQKTSTVHPQTSTPSVSQSSSLDHPAEVDVFSYDFDGSHPPHRTSVRYPSDSESNRKHRESEEGVRTRTKSDENVVNSRVRHRKTRVEDDKSVVSSRTRPRRKDDESVVSRSRQRNSKTSRPTKKRADDDASAATRSSTRPRNDDDQSVVSRRGRPGNKSSQRRAHDDDDQSVSSRRSRQGKRLSQRRSHDDDDQSVSSRRSRQGKRLSQRRSHDDDDQSISSRRSRQGKRLSQRRSHDDSSSVSRSQSRGLRRRDDQQSVVSHRPRRASSRSRDDRSVTSSKSRLVRSVSAARGRRNSDRENVRRRSSRALGYDDDDQDAVSCFAWENMDDKDEHRRGRRKSQQPAWENMCDDDGGYKCRSKPSLSRPRPRRAPSLTKY